MYVRDAVIITFREPLSRPGQEPRSIFTLRSLLLSALFLFGPPTNTEKLRSRPKMEIAQILATCHRSTEWRQHRETFDSPIVPWDGDKGDISTRLRTLAQLSSIEDGAKDT